MIYVPYVNLGLQQDLLDFHGNKSLKNEVKFARLFCFLNLPVTQLSRFIVVNFVDKVLQHCIGIRKLTGNTQLSNC